MVKRYEPLNQWSWTKTAAKRRLALARKNYPQISFKILKLKTKGKARRTGYVFFGRFKKRRK